MAYQVDIAIFTDDDEDVETPTDLSWSILQAEGDVDDSIVVLDGLSFGWTEPDDGLWPVQPDPMACSLAINVPDFSEISVLDGDTLSVEVKADSAGDVIARFYGNVTNWKAVNRSDETGGVTLSLVAVDPIAGLNEAMGLTDIGEFEIIPLEEDVASALWGSFAGPADVSDLWTSPDRSVWPESVQVGAPVNSLSYINGLLLQAVNVEDRTRMIVSPNIGASGAIASDPISGRTFTLDTISSDVAADPSPFEPPANAVLRDAISWTSATGQNPGLIAATGYANDPLNRVLAPVAGPPNRAIQTIEVTSGTEAEAQDAADFYAATAFDQWQVEGVTVEVTDREVDVPVGLFPNWKAGEGDPARAACYGRRILVSGIDPTRTPDGAGVIDGVLVGATCRISAGALELDLAIRRPIDLSHPTDLFILGGYALAPYGELAHS